MASPTPGSRAYNYLSLFKTSCCSGLLGMGPIAGVMSGLVSLLETVGQGEGNLAALNPFRCALRAMVNNIICSQACSYIGGLVGWFDSNCLQTNEP